MVGSVHSSSLLKLRAELAFPQVYSSFGNTSYISNNCQTPVSSIDKDHSAESCIEIEHAGQAYVHHAMLSEGIKLTVRQVS